MTYGGPKRPKPKPKPKPPKRPKYALDLLRWTGEEIARIDRRAAELSRKYGAK